MNNDKIREVYNACLPKLSAWHTDLGQNRNLYEKTLALAESSRMKQLDVAQQKSINDSLLGFRLGGVALDGEEKERYKKIALELSNLGTRFQENILDATKAWDKLLTDQSALAGLPQSSLDLAKQAAANNDQEGYRLTLDFPSYHAVMTFADDRELRKEVYSAYLTRASDQGPMPVAERDNAPLIETIIALRIEKAKLLGFMHYADYSVATKMVKNPDQVIDFIDELAQKAKPAALSDYQQLEEFARDEHDIQSLQPWDLSYYSNKLKKKLFDFSEEDLKPYFPADLAVPGLFKVTSGTQLPIAYLTCNLTPPVGNEPALLTHNEVTTLFHEFGHGLHHMLTLVDYSSVAGISGVEWDAVELPSQFLENWCWERESLDMICGHYKTGEKLPDELLDKARRAKNFQSGMGTVRQLEFGLFDMRIHMSTEPPSADVVGDILQGVRNEVAVYQMPDFVRFQNGFSHIFAGGYAAGYFSYKWAEVLSSDAFSRFEEEGIFNSETGGEFLSRILEKGGTQKALELFVDFRGREPTIDALLRHTGLAA